MKKSFLLVSSLMLFISLPIKSQNLADFVQKFALHKISSPHFPEHGRVLTCDIDSMIIFGFISASDSMISDRRIFKKYGSQSRAIHEYGYTDGSGILRLKALDSTVFDQNGRPVLNEIWEYDVDSSKILLKERTQFYPHDGNVKHDYSFLDHMSNELNLTQAPFC